MVCAAQGTIAPNAGPARIDAVVDRVQHIYAPMLGLLSSAMTSADENIRRALSRRCACSI